MYNWVILVGIGVGTLTVLSGLAADTAQEVIWEFVGFLARLIGTCAVFYGFFLCRMLGAGDIKLMAVSVGILGVWRGCLVIFFGMVLALAIACIKGKIWKHGILQMKNQELRLAPYLFAGYILLVLLTKNVL